MPTYCYTTEDGETVYRVRPMRDRNRGVRLPDGRRASRDISAEGRTPARGCREAGNIFRQHRSVALGVNPSQIPQAEKTMADAGVHTTYDTRTGDALFHSDAQLKAHMKVAGQGDFDAVSGPVPSDFTSPPPSYDDVSDPGRSNPAPIPDRLRTS